MLQAMRCPRRGLGVADTVLMARMAHGSGNMLRRRVAGEGIDPHIPVFDNPERKDGARPTTDFTVGHEANAYRVSRCQYAPITARR